MYKYYNICAVYRVRSHDVKTDLCSNYIIIIIDNCCDKYFLLFLKRKVLVFQEEQYPSIIHSTEPLSHVVAENCTRVRFPSHHRRPTYYETGGDDNGCS